MINAFPKAARYDVIMKRVFEFFIEEGIQNFPINPFKIIKKNKWGLITYSELAIENNLTIDQVKNAFGSQDGYVIYDGINYTIAYNDTMENPYRIRFTLMHEIGHIKLKHLTDFEETILTRSSISKGQYKILEREANAFARNVLSPPFIVNQMREKFGSFVTDDTSYIFKISGAAVKTRMQMLNWDLFHISAYTPALQVRFKSFMSKILNSKQCLVCGQPFISRYATYCPICANKLFSSRRRVRGMIFRGFDVDENGKAIVCPRCGNEEISEHATYCKICGTILINMCTNVDYDERGVQIWGCGATADGNARYCIKCGAETTFFREGLLLPWDKELEEEKAKHREHLQQLFSS